MNINFDICLLLVFIYILVISNFKSSKYRYFMSKFKGDKKAIIN